MIKIELTDEERDTLFHAYEEWIEYTSARNTAIGLKLYPKKESVEFYVRALDSSFNYKVSLTEKEIRFCGVKLSHNAFDSIYAAYNAKKHEVADV